MHENQGLEEFPFFLGVRELAQILPYHKGYINMMFKNGELLGRKLKGRWLVTKDELVRWIQGNSTTSAEIQ